MFRRITAASKLMEPVICIMIWVSVVQSARALPGGAAFKGSEDKADSASLSQLINQWSEASAAHLPGRADPPAVTIGSWPVADLEPVLAHIHRLASQSDRALKRNLARGNVRRMLGLTEQEAQAGDLTRLLKQGALLHTDIAILELARGAPADSKELTGLFTDGRLRLLLSGSQDAHWKFARELLDLLPPATQGPLVRRWYEATTAYLQSRRDRGRTGRNLNPALKLFPTDAHLNFYAGALHEIYASPASQNRTLSPRLEISYGSAEKELKSARKFLQKAVEADPKFMEARLRYGRVLGLLGEHKQAAAELQLATASISDPQLLYYASLYLGYELETLAQTGEAREQYERAVRLYPTAQSPLLALSHLAHRSNDVNGALSCLQQVFALNVKDIWKDDPLWSYDVAHVRNASKLIAEMYGLFGGASQ